MLIKIYTSIASWVRTLTVPGRWFEANYGDEGGSLAGAADCEFAGPRSDWSLRDGAAAAAAAAAPLSGAAALRDSAAVSLWLDHEFKLS